VWVSRTQGLRPGLRYFAASRLALGYGQWPRYEKIDVTTEAQRFKTRAFLGDSVVAIVDFFTHSEGLPNCKFA
jgi:hypothetical protein